MRIKRIDLCGFKSFCDKVNIDLQQKVTGIVGPNGCGKSNVVDALRWAMGEMSARHLRGKSMEDVIFNGSDSRGPSGMAEVSITFINDGRVPVEYLNYTEITVTRRLHRDGNSEYLINKVPVRLRDITNLFLGTGVGTKAYSIIEQGRVGMIVSSKPYDRRHFIEEAAGITKYRTRKRAAERKMDATRQNLLRVTDVLDEIGKRLGSLRRQAKKAERYKRYREEMRDIDMWSASHKLLEFIGENKVLNTGISSLGKQQAEAENALQVKDLAVEAARLAAVEFEREVSGAQEKLYQLDNRIKLNENAVEFQTREADELVARSAQSSGEVEELKRQLAEVEEQLAAVGTQADQLGIRKGEFAEVLAGKEAILGNLRDELAQVEAAVEDERRGIAESERQIAGAVASLHAMTRREEDLDRRRVRCGEEAARIIDRVAELNGTATDLDGALGGLRLSRDEIEGTRRDQVKRREDLTEISAHGEQKLEVLRDALHQRRSRLRSLKEIHDRYEGLGRGTRAIMSRANGSAKEEGILGVVADMLDAPPDYETALEAVLGHRLGAIIVESDEIGRDAIGYLKESKQGRTSFIARDSRRGGWMQEAPVGVVWQSAGGGRDMPQVYAAGGGSTALASGVHGQILALVNYQTEYERVAENLLSDVVVVDNLDRAMELWDRVENQTIVTLDGEILQPDGTVTGGSKDAELAGVLPQKREIKELTEIIADLEVQYQTSLDEHVRVKTELAALGQALDKLTRDEHQGDKDILTREKDLGRIKSEVDSMLARRGELDSEIEQISTSLDEMAAEERSLQESVLSASVVKKLGADMLYLLGRERLRLIELAKVATSDMTDSKVALAEASASYQAAKENVDQLHELRNDRSQRIERLTGSAQDGIRRSEELRANVEKMREELLELIGEKAAQEDCLIAARKSYEQKQEEVGELEVSLREVRARASELGVEIGKLQIRASELKMGRQHLDEQIWDRYREELPKVAGDYHMRSPVSKEQLERLDQVRQLIERMGEINLTAITEYEELSERHDFLSKNRADLEGALDQLTRAIQRINRTSRKRFRETFDKINEKFQELFPRLFNGGRAHLALSEAADVLDAGVEIVAQPPGKKLQSIDSMSGGEKALTAVSMIFAMFLVKPTPFCLLDEVDAPLDDANVNRFRQLVREMSDISQFIVITHNRVTMEIVDKLYGVTMQEPGVSKLLSVNLEQISNDGSVDDDILIAEDAVLAN